MRTATLACLLAVGLGALPLPGAAQRPVEGGGTLAGGETLALDDVLALARERSPRLAALRDAATAAAAREPGASTLPDPTLQLGVMNFGVPSLNTDMAMSMAPSVQLMQMVPFPGKLSLRGDIAELGTAIALSGVDEAWWELRGQAATHFYELYSLDRRIEVMTRTLGLLRDFQEVAKAMYAAGTGRQADVLRADVEVARMDGEIRSMQAMRTSRAARLNALLDLPADAPVPSPALGSGLPTDIPEIDTLRAWARDTRPALVRGDLGVRQAGQRVALAHKQIWPDLSLGLAYGQRDRGFGTERMGSAMVGVSLPIHAGSRQYAERDEAAAMERLARAELQGLEASVDARIAELLAELRRTRELSELYRDEVIPEARATVESAFSSYRVGRVDFMTLVDAEMTLNRYESELYLLIGQYGAALTGLESAVGRSLPREGSMLTEER